MSRPLVFALLWIGLLGALTLGNMPGSAAQEGTRLFLPLTVGGTIVAASPIALINEYRAQAGLPPTFEVAAWVRGCELHARYMVKTDTVTHIEDPASPWYTPEGAQAGRYSDLMGHSYYDLTAEQAIAALMGTAFHRLGFINPQLVGGMAVGGYREEGGRIQAAYCFDTSSGLDWNAPSPVPFPQMWPAEGTVVRPAHLGTFRGGEVPHPLAACPNYSAPVGLPITFMVDEGWPNAGPVRVTTHELRQSDGTLLEHCVFDRTTYTSPVPNETTWGHNVLSHANAVVIIPRAPLVAGETYTVSLTVNDIAHTWSFRIAEE